MINCFVLGFSSAVIPSSGTSKNFEFRNESSRSGHIAFSHPIYIMSIKKKELQKFKDNSNIFPVIHHTNYGLLKNDQCYPSPLPRTNVLDQDSTNVKSFAEQYHDDRWVGMPKMPDIIPFVVRRMKSDVSCAVSDISLSPKSPTISNKTKMSGLIQPSLKSDHSISNFIEDDGDIIPYVVLPPLNSIPPQNRK